MNCLTDEGTYCVFPFTYKEKTYQECTQVDSENSKGWCATSVNENGEYNHNWAGCWSCTKCEKDKKKT